MVHATIEEYISDGGSDIVLRAAEGMTFEDGSTEMVLHVRADHGPKIGDTVVIRGRTFTVADRRYSSDHTLWVMDEDTRAWEKV